MNKITRPLIVLSLCAAVAGLTGCGKESNTPPPTPHVPPAPAAAAPKAAPAAPTATAPAAPASADSAQAQSMLDKAKALIDNKDYAGAVNALKGLQNLQLTPEQHKLWEDLKSQAQKAMAGDASQKATDAVGGMLK